MSDMLSANTNAILLLTAPLIAGRPKNRVDLLTSGEYKKLAMHLRQVGAQPADLVTPAANPLLGDCDRIIRKDRLERLLARGFLLSQAVEHWQARAIWVVSRADAAYPPRLRARLKEDSPALLYGCGERQVLDSGGLAVVGSRNVDDALIEYTQEIGRIAALGRRTLVSGGARGIDQAAMRGALEAGGKVIGVLADSLERTAMTREHRNLLLQGQLVLISPYDPKAGFNVGHAMQRNKVIYALSDAALVVSTDQDKGGTWAGATEQLEKLHLVPVYVRSTGETTNGLEALRKKGALPWPNPGDTDGLNVALSASVPTSSPSLEQKKLSFVPQRQDKEPDPEEPAVASSEPASSATNPADPLTLDAADELFKTVRSVIHRVVREPKKAAEVAKDMAVTQRQAEEWLKRLVDERELEKSKKPVRYSVRQASLLDSVGAPEPAAKTKPARARK
ncbi:MAG: DNA-processing protein DprA [Acidobacteria bacterium]|nr:MAG: DNA-processing protein DprA [Acidobacteriota bacterium]